MCATVLVFFHEPLPWSEDYGAMPVLPDIYMFGVWVSIVLAILFISLYAWQVSEQSRQFVNAIAATELVLAREQHLTELDGLAAAAAHALGTPLSTISVIARELEREIDPKSPHAEDIRLLREQTQRCRDILAKLNELQAEGEPFDRMPLATSAARGGRAASQFRDRGRRAICRRTRPRRSPPAIRRSCTGSATFWRTRSISPATGWRSRPTGAATKSRW